MINELKSHYIHFSLLLFVIIVLLQFNFFLFNIQSYKNTFKENIIDIMTNEVLIKEKFTLKSYVKGDDYYIKFIPLKSDIEDNIFLLVINNNRIKEISFMNDFEQSVIMKFKDFKNNVSILDSLFKIDIPKNFDVIVDK